MLVVGQFLRFGFAARLDLQELILDRLLAHIHGSQLIGIVPVDPSSKYLLLREELVVLFARLEHLLVARFRRYLGIQ